MPYANAIQIYIYIANKQGSLFSTGGQNVLALPLLQRYWTSLSLWPVELPLTLPVPVEDSN